MFAVFDPSYLFIESNLLYWEIFLFLNCPLQLLLPSITNISLLIHLFNIFLASIMLQVSVNNFERLDPGSGKDPESSFVN